MRVPVAVLMQKKRHRVCEACVQSTDDKIGAVHSELPCVRCKCSPCWGFIVDPAGPAVERIMRNRSRKVPGLAGPKEPLEE